MHCWQDKPLWFMSRSQGVIQWGAKMPSLLLYMHTSMSVCLFDSLCLPLSRHWFLLFPSISLIVSLHHSCSVSLLIFCAKTQFFILCLIVCQTCLSWTLSHSCVSNCLDYIIYFATYVTFQPLQLIGRRRPLSENVFCNYCTKLLLHEKPHSLVLFYFI